MSKKIYDAMRISQAEANLLFSYACFFGDTKDEVRNQEHAGVLVGWAEECFEFAGMLGGYRYLRVSGSLNKLLNLARKHGKVGERMLDSYWTFMHGLDLMN